jgi:GxxExxY protein
MEFDALSNQVIGCAIESTVCSAPGLLESTYEQCLAQELGLAGIGFKLQHPLPVQYKASRWIADTASKCWLKML